MNPTPPVSPAPSASPTPPAPPAPPASPTPPAPPAPPASPIPPALRTPSTPPAFRLDLTRLLLSVLALLLLIGGSLWILAPFLPALIWATAIAVATWPLLESLQRLLWGRRALAAVALTLALLLMFFVPLALAVSTVLDNAEVLAGWARALAGFHEWSLPEWVQRLPLVGERVVVAWRELAAAGAAGLAARITPYLGGIVSGLAREATGVGAVLVQLLLTVAITLVLYLHGERAAHGVLRFASRLAGSRGERMVLLTGQSIRGVALGVVVTAIVQSVLGGLGLVAAGIPAAMLLTAVMLLLSIAQLGPFLVLLPAAAWLWWDGQTGWAIGLLAWTMVVGSIDNVVRPFLIRKGADLPLLLIFAGVIGGLVAFGLVGIFIGPVVLAVTYTMLGAWMDEAPAAQGATSVTPDRS